MSDADDTLDWGCEGRKKLGIARGRILSLLEFIEEAPSDGWPQSYVTEELARAREDFDSTGQPGFCALTPKRKTEIDIEIERLGAKADAVGRVRDAQLRAEVIQECIARIQRDTGGAAARLGTAALKGLLTESSTGGSRP